MGRAKLILKEKLTVRHGLLRVATIWRIPKSDRYPDGIRYRLALVDVLEGKVLTLFDNHYPKGHHQHLVGGVQVPYAFESIEKLVLDYRAVVAREIHAYKKD